MVPELRRLQAFNNPGRLEIEEDNHNFVSLCRRLQKEKTLLQHSKELGTIKTSRNVRNGGKQFDKSSIR